MAMRVDIQFPIAKAHMAVEEADLMCLKAATVLHGRTVRGRGYHDQIRSGRFREWRLCKAAPINNKLVLAYVGQHVLGMPRSNYALGAI
jgi:acyl-CoA dehydrogenase